MYISKNIKLFSIIHFRQRINIVLASSEVGVGIHRDF